jgi:hypothetical protein
MFQIGADMSHTYGLREKVESNHCVFQNKIEQNLSINYQYGLEVITCT